MSELANDRELYVEYDINGQKFKGRGHPNDLNKHVALYAAMVAPDNGSVQLKLPEVFIESDDTPQLPTNSVSSEQIVSNNGNNSQQKADIPDLPSFYIDVSVTKQVEQPPTILYWYEKYQECETLNKEQFKDAFNELRKAGVKPPTDKLLKQMLDNATYKNNYLYRADDGGYGLSIPGRKHIQELLNGDGDSTD